MPLSVTAVGSGVGGLTTLAIERAESYHLDRPDESHADGYEGETVFMHSQIGEDPIDVTVDSLMGALDDGAKYRIVATVQDGLGQSAVDLLEFEVHWEHQAVIPEANVVIDDENLVAKITDPKDGSKFVYGKGQYGFQLCCVHNLVDFILCFVKNADDMKDAGIYNISDKLLTTAADIITFMRENHHLGTVVQKSGGGAMTKLKGLFGGGKEEKTNYRYLDMSKMENNNMLDNTKAAKFVNFRWDIHNTK